MLAYRPTRVQDVSHPREKESALNEVPTSFNDHINRITELVEEVEDDRLRVKIYDVIETLIKNMNGEWYGAVATWRIGEVPDDPHELFDE